MASRYTAYHFPTSTSSAYGSENDITIGPVRIKSASSTSKKQEIQKLENVQPRRLPVRIRGPHTRRSRSADGTVHSQKKTRMLPVRIKHFSQNMEVPRTVGSNKKQSSRPTEARNVRRQLYENIEAIPSYKKSTNDQVIGQKKVQIVSNEVAVQQNEKCSNATEEHKNLDKIKKSAGKDHSQKPSFLVQPNFIVKSHIRKTLLTNEIFLQKTTVQITQVDLRNNSLDSSSSSKERDTFFSRSLGSEVLADVTSGVDKLESIECEKETNTNLINVAVQTDKTAENKENSANVEEASEENGLSSVFAENLSHQITEQSLVQKEYDVFQNSDVTPMVTKFLYDFTSTTDGDPTSYQNNVSRDNFDSTEIENIKNNKLINPMEITCEISKLEKKDFVTNLEGNEMVEFQIETSLVSRTATCIERISDIAAEKVDSDGKEIKQEAIESESKESEEKIVSNSQVDLLEENNVDETETKESNEIQENILESKENEEDNNSEIQKKTEDSNVSTTRVNTEPGESNIEERLDATSNSEIEPIDAENETESGTSKTVMVDRSTFLQLEAQLQDCISDTENNLHKLQDCLRSVRLVLGNFPKIVLPNLELQKGGEVNSENKPRRQSRQSTQKNMRKDSQPEKKIENVATDLTRDSEEVPNDCKIQDEKRDAGRPADTDSTNIDENKENLDSAEGKQNKRSRKSVGGSIPRRKSVRLNKTVSNSRSDGDLKSLNPGSPSKVLGNGSSNLLKEEPLSVTSVESEPRRRSLRLILKSSSEKPEAKETKSTVKSSKSTPKSTKLTPISPKSTPKPNSADTKNTPQSKSKLRKETTVPAARKSLKMSPTPPGSPNSRIPTNSSKTKPIVSRNLTGSNGKLSPIPGTSSSEDSFVALEKQLDINHDENSNRNMTPSPRKTEIPKLREPLNSMNQNTPNTRKIERPLREYIALKSTFLKSLNTPDASRFLPRVGSRNSFRIANSNLLSTKIMDSLCDLCNDDEKE